MSLEHRLPALLQPLPLHIVLTNGNGKYNYDIFVLQVGMVFNGIANLIKAWLLFKREFPRVSMMWRGAGVGILNVNSKEITTIFES